MALKNFPLDSLYFTGLLKEGYFSYIYLAQYKTKDGTNRTVVLKTFKEKSTSNAFKHDISFFQQIDNNKNIVEIIGYFYDQNLRINGFAMPYEALAIGGRIISDLHTYLVFIRENFTREEDENECEIPFFSQDEELHTFAIQIAKGCEYLHEKGMIHGDLACRNILLDKDKNIKLTDYSLHCLKEEIIKGSSLNFVSRWSSPECSYPGIKSSRESDVWSFGVVLWEIGTLGGLPYCGLKLEKIHAIGNQRAANHPLQIENGTQDFKELISKCLIKEPNERLKFPEITKELTRRKCLEIGRGNCKLYKTLRRFDPSRLPTISILTDPTNITSCLPKFNVSPVTFVKDLGSGQFGTSTLGKLASRIKPGCYGFVVEKKINKFFYRKGGRFIDQIDEVFTTVKNHPNVAKIMAIYDFQYTLLMEYQSISINNGAIHLTGLQKYLLHLRQELEAGEDPDVLELGWFSFQIARGMKHLHKQGIVHGNLAARNILINQAKILKITDYFCHGTGNYLKEVDRDYWPSCRWVSPESIKTGKFTLENDVWAFGVVLWEIATLGAFPYGSSNSDDIIKRQEIIKMPTTVTDELKAFMLSCWNLVPLKRPKFTELSSSLLTTTSRKELFSEFDTSLIRSFQTKEEIEGGMKKSGSATPWLRGAIRKNYSTRGMKTSPTITYSSPPWGGQSFSPKKSPHVGSYKVPHIFPSTKEKAQERDQEPETSSPPRESFRLAVRTKETETPLSTKFASQRQDPQSFSIKRRSRSRTRRVRQIPLSKIEEDIEKRDQKSDSTSETPKRILHTDNRTGITDMTTPTTTMPYVAQHSQSFPPPENYYYNPPSILLPQKFSSVTTPTFPITSPFSSPESFSENYIMPQGTILYQSPTAYPQQEFLVMGTQTLASTPPVTSVFLSPEFPSSGYIIPFSQIVHHSPLAIPQQELAFTNIQTVSSPSSVSSQFPSPEFPLSGYGMPQGNIVYQSPPVYLQHEFTLTGTQTLLSTPSISSQFPSPEFQSGHYIVPHSTGLHQSWPAVPQQELALTSSCSLWPSSDFQSGGNTTPQSPGPYQSPPTVQLQELDLTNSQTVPFSPPVDYPHQPLELPITGSVIPQSIDLHQSPSTIPLQEPVLTNTQTAPSTPSITSPSPSASGGPTMPHSANVPQSPPPISQQQFASVSTQTGPSISPATSSFQSPESFSGSYKIPYTPIQFPSPQLFSDTRALPQNKFTPPDAHSSTRPIYRKQHNPLAIYSTQSNTSIQDQGAVLRLPWTLKPLPAKEFMPPVASSQLRRCPNCQTFTNHFVCPECSGLVQRS